MEENEPRGQAVRGEEENELLSIEPIDITTSKGRVINLIDVIDL
jgi:hypothetical protein